MSNCQQLRQSCQLSRYDYDLCIVLAWKWEWQLVCEWVCVKQNEISHFRLVTFADSPKPEIKKTSLPKVIWKENRVAAKLSHGRFDNVGESGRRRIYYAAPASTDTVGWASTLSQGQGQAQSSSKNRRRCKCCSVSFRRTIVTFLLISHKPQLWSWN